MTDGKMENENSFEQIPDPAQRDAADSGFSFGSSLGAADEGAYTGKSSSAGTDDTAGYTGYSGNSAENGADSASSFGGRAPDGQGDSAGYHSASTEQSRRYYSYDRGTSAGYGYSGSGTDSGSGSEGHRKGSRRLGLILAVILVFILGAGAGAYVSGKSATAALSGTTRGAAAGAEAAEESTGGNEKQDGESPKQEDSTASGGENTIPKVADEGIGTSLQDTSVADVAEKVMPSIVSVYNKYTEKSQFFGRTYTQEAEAAGSGIIIEESDGELLIVTNNHVVEGADSLSVQFIDEENCEAALKGTDVSSDLAVISVSLDDLSADTKSKIAIAELGDSDSLRIGEHAIAIGNALGYGQSLTVGYISALNREMTSENGITGTFIQTDAAINPGNSGGALLNSRGQVIGINSNKIGGSTVEGMGFAIPISKAVPIIDSLKKQESRTKVAEEDQGVLGIYGISVTSDVASAYGLPVGAYVEELIEGGGAAQSDLQQGDIITGINGQTVTGMDDLQQQLSFYAAGTEVTLTVQHPMEGGSYEEREISVTLTKRTEMETSRNSGNGRQQEQQQALPYEDEEDSGFFSFPFGF
ncbi:MAG: trypsin-like peptidase domain-containing protein [Lachnospiraceae bacterium]|nr:trypsin-like peptidase domain-containing protein [Lachnospiraceae bacterium]